MEIRVGNRIAEVELISKVGNCVRMSIDGKGLDLDVMMAENGVCSILMDVAGDHANNDMAGDEDDSWKSQLTAEGYEVECLIHGLGENEAIQQIYVEHTQAAVDGLNK